MPQGSEEPAQAPADPQSGTFPDQASPTMDLLLNGEMAVGKELKAVDDINLYRPADFDGKVLHLHTAQGEVYMQLAEAGG